MLPVSLVVCNDCFAFFCGKLFGRKFIKTPFLRLSPNKTWEGFIGAFVCTIVFAVFSSAWLAKVHVCLNVRCVGAIDQCMLTSSFSRCCVLV